LFQANYLDKRAVNFFHLDIPSINSDKYFSSIVVIPSYCESNYITNTLNSLNNQLDFDLSKMLVLIVVNNSTLDSSEVIVDNINTMTLIANFNSRYQLRYIDVSTDKKALPDNLAGVGYSRKIGMDYALKYSREDTILHCLDADVLIDPFYLSKVNEFYKENDSRALIVDFEHQKENDEELNKHIRSYELFLKKTAQDIRNAGSPYGYVALGPTITCLASTYVRVGGMVKKKATEDFYFLQKIRKFTKIDFLNEKLVFPSARLSERVYLGTGFRMRELIKGKSIDDLYYSKKSYEILRKTIKKVLSLYTEDSSLLKKELINIEESLYPFLNKQGLFDVWGKINKESKTNKQFKLQFHKWFDNLKTLRLLKFYS